MGESYMLLPVPPVVIIGTTSFIAIQWFNCVQHVLATRMYSVVQLRTGNLIHRSGDEVVGKEHGHLQLQTCEYEFYLNLPGVKVCSLTDEDLEIPM
jgi:hypothetical protein